MQKLHYQYKPILCFSKILLFIIAVITCQVSCTPSKKILYFQNLPTDTTLHNLVTKDFELKIKKGDIINIGVSSLSSESSGIFTAPETSSGSSGAGAGPGYLVDIDGNILYPKLGVLHVEGLTRDELRNRLMKDMLPYLKEPIVTVNFVNHKIVMMGAINQVLNMQNETITILEAISQSGGIPITARKDNVLVIRENGTDKQFKRLNLNNSSIFTSPYYYLKPNDIVYVEPEVKKEGISTQQIIGYISTAFSITLIILDRIIK